MPNILFMIAIQIFVFGLYAYLLIGFLFALWFVFRGVHRLDEQSRTAHWVTRLLWLPGSMLLWPVLTRKIVFKKSDPANDVSQ